MGTEVIPSKDENTEKATELEQKIIRQIEYYFGNFNLSRDKFLKQEIQNDDGWVPLETMVKFQRLKQLTTDFQTISDALKKSPNQLMEVNEDCTKIRRKVPVLDNIDKDEIDDRTLYVKRFKKDTKLDEILEFFKDYKVENVTMRKQKQGKEYRFNGSVFAVFQTKEDSEAFLGKKGLKFDKFEMIIEKKNDYVKRKDEFYDNLRAERAKKEADKIANGEKESPEVTGCEIKNNCLLKVTGLGSASTREDLKEALEEYGTIAFVDYFKSKPEAVVRFEEGIVPEFLTKFEEEDGNKKLQVGSVKATVSLIEGDDEIKYWKDIAKSRANSRNKFNNFKQGHKGRFGKKPRRGGYQGRNKRGADDDNEELEGQRSKKKLKVEPKEDTNGNEAKIVSNEEAHKDESSSKNESNDVKIEPEVKMEAE